MNKKQQMQQAIAELLQPMSEAKEKQIDDLLDVICGTNVDAAQHIEQAAQHIYAAIKLCNSTGTNNTRHYRLLCEAYKTLSQAQQGFK